MQCFEDVLKSHFDIQAAGKNTEQKKAVSANTTVSKLLSSSSTSAPQEDTEIVGVQDGVALLIEHHLS